MKPSSLSRWTPWVLLGIFIITNSLLSYFPLSFGARLWAGLLGLVLPAVAGFQAMGSSRQDPWDQREFLPPIPPWVWLLVLTLALGARFLHITTLFVWPNFDESSYGFDAFQLADHGAPRLFYGVSQAPPLFIWGLAVFFKAFGVSLASLWSFPALASLSVLPLAYWAARSFFSRSFSFLAAVLLSLSFWPVFVGHFSLMTILILPAECLALGALGRFLCAPDFRARKKSALVLGFIWGAGCYTHLHWPVVIALTALPIAVWFFNLPSKNKNQILPLAIRMAGSALLIVLPLAIGAYREHYGGYLQHLWAFNEHYYLSRQVTVWLSCLTSPFWGMDPNVHTYQPEWGGFLNPVLSSLFFLGLMEIAARPPRPLTRWLLAGLFLCLLPGLLTQDMETFRLFPMVPLLVIGVLMGLSRLMLPSAPVKNMVLFFLLLLPSLALDGYHLFGAYHHLWDNPATWGFYTKSIGRYRAYQTLEEWKARKGPGFIFPDFVQGLTDQSLSVAVHDFNASQNPKLDPAQASWAAVLTNVNYQPFLKKRFPDGTSYSLSKDLNPADGGWMLFVFPLDDQRRVLMEGWKKAQTALEPFLDKNLCYVMGSPFEEDLAVLALAQEAFQGDPFLRSVYWEKKSDLETKQELMWRNSSQPVTAQSQAVESLERAIGEGYPAAHLYEHLGALRLMRQETQLARMAFERALLSPLNLTDAAHFLKAMERPSGGKREP